MSENILEVKGLTKDYGDFVLDKLTFTVPKGVIMGLIGENGAGKSTTINCILNEISKTDGNIEIFGKDFLVVRNELLHLIGEIHMQEKSVNELDEKFHGIEETLNALYLSAPSTTDDAVVAASIALGTNKDYTYTNDEIDRFLPPTLKGTIKKKEYVDGTSN